MKVSRQVSGHASRQVLGKVSRKVSDKSREGLNASLAASIGESLKKILGASLKESPQATLGASVGFSGQAWRGYDVMNDVLMWHLDMRSMRVCDVLLTLSRRSTYVIYLRHLKEIKGLTRQRGVCGVRLQHAANY